MMRGCDTYSKRKCGTAALSELIFALKSVESFVFGERMKYECNPELSPCRNNEDKLSDM